MQMAPLYERRTGPKKLAIGEDVAPATTLWNPMLPGLKSYPAARMRLSAARAGAAALPGNRRGHRLRHSDAAFALDSKAGRSRRSG